MHFCQLTICSQHQWISHFPRTGCYYFKKDNLLLQQIYFIRVTFVSLTFVEFEKLKSSYPFLKENILFWLRSTHYPNSKGTEEPNKRMLNRILTNIQMFLSLMICFWTKGKFLEKKTDYRTWAIIPCSCKKKRPLKNVFRLKKVGLKYTSHGL